MADNNSPLPVNPVKQKRQDEERQKKKKKRKITAIVTAVVLLFALFASQYYNSYGVPFVKDKTAIPVGILVNKQDEQSGAIKQGAVKAIKQVNQSGGINGIRVKTIVVNSKTSHLAKDYDKLKSKTNCIIYAGIENDFLKKAVSPVMMPEGKPVNNSNVLRFKYSDAEEAQALSEYFTKGARQYEIGVLLNLDTSLKKYNTFKADYKKLNGRIKQVEAYGDLDTNFDSQFARFKNKNIPLVYAPTLERAQLKAIMASANKYKIAVAAGNQINDYQNSDLASCEGITFTNAFVSEGQTSKKIVSLFGQSRRNHDMILGYDAARFMIACYRESASVNIAKTMHRISYNGISNKYTFDSRGNPQKIEISIVQMIQGERKQLSKYWI